jgi:hypothetical protein
VTPEREPILWRLFLSAQLASIAGAMAWTGERMAAAGSVVVAASARLMAFAVRFGEGP